MPFIAEGKTRLHYQKLGHGPKAMLAFHGFGQNSSYFLPVAQALGNRYTIYSFDLFFHGESQLAPEHIPLTKKFLNRLLQQFLESEQLGRFSIIAFSMGGKFALATLESFADKIDNVFLIAPDGIKTSFWYNVATYPGWLSGFFRRTVEKPQPFFRLVDVLGRYKLMHPGVLRFASFHMSSEAKRYRVYKSWTSFRLLSFDLKRIAHLLNEHKIPIVFFLGHFDEIITTRGLKFFTDSLQHCQVIILKTGHTFLLQRVGEYFRKHPDIQ